jgi:hypothetical protein
VVSILWGLLGRASLYHWSPQSRCHPFPPFLTEDGSRASFRNFVLKGKHWTMDKVLTQRFFEMHHTIVRTPHNRFITKYVSLDLSFGMYCRVKIFDRRFRGMTIILHGSTSQKTNLNFILAAVRT